MFVLKLWMFLNYLRMGNYDENVITISENYYIIFYINFRVTHGLSESNAPNAGRCIWLFVETVISKTNA